TPTAQEVVDKAIQASKTDLLNHAEASFSFRDKQYEYQRDGGQFVYTRIQTDSTGNIIRDVYSNEGLKRYIEREETSLSEKKQNAYANSVNSVIYFAFLPLWLNDAAVNKNYEGINTIKGKKYHRIRVTFNQEGGGDDFDDIFLYWFDTEDYSMDYLAYKYNTNGGGMRFREAYNVQTINGITIQDYHNLKPRKKGSISFDQIDEAYKKGELEELSTIELKNIKININK
ncbi:DUF6503 family protein, partial [Xanthovirga aplysinae]|uniref:DUF6503 family protein n=1 Tax=Xanthovirga aplysinae TaxID=2529853 RepID=UPI00165695E9